MISLIGGNPVNSTVMRHESGGLPETLSVLAALQVTDSCDAIALGVAYAKTTIVQSEAVCSRCARTACLRCRRDGSILSRRARVYVGLWRPIIRCRLARQLSDPLR